MFYSPMACPGSDALYNTHPNQRVWRRMQVIADTIGGSVDAQAGLRHPAMFGCILMADAGLLIAGTATPRPMWLADGQNVAQLTGLDILLVRTSIHDATFDVYLAEDRTWLVDYVLWQSEGASWLFPTGGYGPLVQVTQNGLFTSREARFMNHQDRQAGLSQRLAFFSRKTGWVA